MVESEGLCACLQLEIVAMGNPWAEGEDFVVNECCGGFVEV